MINLLLGLALLGGDASSAPIWPAFRGHGDSRTELSNLPVEWSEESLAWKAELPGYGQSSPVVAGSRAFLTSVVGPKKENLLVTAVDVAKGTVLWTKEFASAQPWEDSDYVSKAAPTPAVDAERVYAFFESGDLITLDHEGSVVWQRSLSKEYGEYQGNHGGGSSPALTDDTLVVLMDHAGPSYLLAVDKKTGENVWKVDRPSKTSWSSPIVIRRDGSEEILISSNGAAEAYRAADGELLWSMEGLSDNNVPSPSAGDGLVVIPSTQPRSNVAIPLSSEGKVSDAGLAWRSSSASSSFGSPLVHEGRVYFVNRSGVAFCLDVKTGATHWQERISGSCWASPVGTPERVYFFDKSGTTTVIRGGDSFEKLAENSVPTNDKVYGVAAIDGAFLVRTGKVLYRIGE